MLTSSIIVQNILFKTFYVFLQQIRHLLCYGNKLVLSMHTKKESTQNQRYIKKCIGVNEIFSHPRFNFLVVHYQTFCCTSVRLVSHNLTILHAYIIIMATWILEKKYWDRKRWFKLQKYHLILSYYCILSSFNTCVYSVTIIFIFGTLWRQKLYSLREEDTWWQDLLRAHCFNNAVLSRFSGFSQVLRKIIFCYWYKFLFLNSKK